MSDPLSCRDEQHSISIALRSYWVLFSIKHTVLVQRQSFSRGRYWFQNNFDRDHSNDSKDRRGILDVFPIDFEPIESMFAYNVAFKLFFCALLLLINIIIHEN